MKDAINLTCRSRYAWLILSIHVRPMAANPDASRRLSLINLEQLIIPMIDNLLFFVLLFFSLLFFASYFISRRLSDLDSSLP